MKELSGRTALLTGASGGIGRKIAETLADAGVNLVLTGRREAALAEVAAAVERKGVRAAVVPADLSDFDAIDGLVASAEAALGPIDILVNNAGIETAAEFTDFTRAELTALVDTNLTSPMLLTQRVLPGMQARGRGHVVFVASASGRFASAFEAPYSATKAALIALSQSLRAENLDSPVGFSVVSPGYVAGDGMYQRLVDAGNKSPRLLGHTTTDKVAAAVVRAIRRDSVEILPVGAPARPLIALGVLAPKSQERLLARLGMHKFFSAVAKAHGRLG